MADQTPDHAGELTMSERETALKEVPLAIRHEAQRCAVQNGRIDPEYLIGLWRRGAAFRTVVDRNGEILTQAAVDRLLAALPPGDAPQTCEWREDRHGYAGPGCHGGIRSFSRIERERWTVCPYCAGRLITEVTR